MAYTKKIVVIGTGGTIAGQSGSAEDLTAYQAGELTIDEVLAIVPGVKIMALLKVNNSVILTVQI